MSSLHSNQAARWPLPQGVVDLFYGDAAEKRLLEQRLRALFTAWSYDEIIPPTFEYADTLASEAGTQIAEEMYRFTDRDGRTLALRPDMTIPTARVVGTRLYDQPMPLRLSYIGSVFRYERPQAGRQREFTQAGIELIGAGTPDADSEVLALTVESLRCAGLRNFTIVLGQMAYFRGLLQELHADEEQIVALQGALDRQNPSDIRLVLDQMGVAGEQRQALRALPELRGGFEVAQAARGHCLNAAMAGALDWLAELHTRLICYGVDSFVTIDLGETRGMQYYTGITFKGYAAGLGFAICSGGRYDDLVGHFGPAQPAVGCALWLDRMLLARSNQSGRAEPPWASASVLVEAGSARHCMPLIHAWRSAGKRVELDTRGLDLAALREYARRRGIRRILRCHSDGSVVLEVDGAAHFMSLADLRQAAKEWE